MGGDAASLPGSTLAVMAAVLGAAVSTLAVLLIRCIGGSGNALTGYLRATP